MKFTYTSGQRPLAGYTIKHCVGKGAFGEVYFALSDGGKEVALKLIRDDFELRGIDQCLNLKHPNLVHLYDLRTDETGAHWLVMEFIEGQSLRTTLDRHPHGVKPELAVEWFQGLAAGVQHLHDHGIVHRDLKPANIFLEKGKIKVGDYGLCKLMAGSQRSGQTQSVGTVHYMAPEISTGNYNRQIDIYSAGILLHEALTGRVPFDGDSAGEILMKHLTSSPDLSRVPSRFVPVVHKALSKNPVRRFESIAEMSKFLLIALNGDAIVLPSSCIVRDSGRQADKETRRQEDRETGRQESKPTVDENTQRTSFASPEFLSNLLYATLLAAVGSLIWSSLFVPGDFFLVARIFFPTAALSWLVLAISRTASPSPSGKVARGESDAREKHGSRWTMLLVLGLSLGAGTMWLDGYQVPDVQHGGNGPFAQTLPVLGRYLVYFGLMVVLVNWRKLAELRRPARFRMMPVLAAIFWSVIFVAVLPAMQLPLERSANFRWISFPPFVLASIIVQLASPWKKPEPPLRSKKMRLPLT